MAKKYSFPNNSDFKSNEDIFYKIYFEELKKVQKNSDYIKNNEKINLYKSILKNNYNVNTDFIEELISFVEEQIEVEYETAIKKWIDIYGAQSAPLRR